VTTPQDAPRIRHKRWPWIAAGTTAAVLISGGAVYAGTHKDLTLDVAGSDSQVSTFTGTVGSLLDAKHITVGPHDSVTPGRSSKLHDGEIVQVRYGHQVTAEVDGTKTTVWTTALDADGALDALATRGKDVSLVANRSMSGGRSALPLELSAKGPVAVVADGKTHVVQNASSDANAVLAKLGIKVGSLDRVSVEERKGQPDVALVVQRVKVKTEKTHKSIAFKTEQTNDPSRYSDLGSYVKTAGHKGVRTTTMRVTYVDGKATKHVVTGRKVTTAPVEKVVATGTKKRPAPVVKTVSRPAPSTSASSEASTPRSSSSSSSSRSTASTSSSSTSSAPKASQGSAPSSGVWAALARCESGGNPAAVNPSGPYYGLYQFTLGTWRSLGGSGLPSQASAATQTALAQKLQARSGWGQWPACARQIGVL
jgi:uncharacterized protein YabE (DUF348 family)